MPYSQFHDGFWTDPEIRKLSSEEKLIFIWFITNPSRHYSGIYFFEFENISKQTGLSEKIVGKGMDTLSARRFIRYNVDYSMVWVRKMARYEVIRGDKSGLFSDKQTRGIANHFLTLHNCPLILDFMAFYPELEIPYQYPIRQEEEEVKEEVKEEEKDKRYCQPPADAGNSFNAQTLARLWNDKAPPELSKVNLPFKRSPKAMDKIRDAIKRNPDLGWWVRVIERIHQSPFLRGAKGWKASIDFVAGKAEEILDGKYDGSTVSKAASGPMEWLAERRRPNETPG